MITAGTARIVRVDAIDSTAIQVRSHVRQETIEEYRDRILAGDAFPPIVVFAVQSGKPLLADGYHRLAAYRAAGRVEILCDVRAGDRTEAIKFALTANMAHGIRRTNLDKETCVLLAFSEFPDHSNRAIALLCGVSHTFVSKCRRPEVATVASSTAQLATVASSNPPTPAGGNVATPDPEGTTAELATAASYRTGLDGKRRKLPTPKTPLELLKNVWQEAKPFDRDQFLDWAQEWYRQQISAKQTPVEMRTPTLHQNAGIPLNGSTPAPSIAKEANFD